MNILEFDVDELYNFLLDFEMFTENELQLVTSLNGYLFSTLMDCLYIRYGITDLQQLQEQFEEV